MKDSVKAPTDLESKGYFSYHIGFTVDDDGIGLELLNHIPLVEDGAVIKMVPIEAFEAMKAERDFWEEKYRSSRELYHIITDTPDYVKSANYDVLACRKELKGGSK